MAFTRSLALQTHLSTLDRLSMRLRSLTIACRTLDNTLRLRQFAHDFDRHAYSQHFLRNTFTLSHQRTSSNNGTGAYLRVRKHYRIHADQHPITDGCSMHNGIMSNGTFLTNSQWCITIHMQRTIILDIGATSNHNWRTISAYYCVIPDTGSLMNGHIANNHGSWCNKYILCNRRPYSLKRKNRHKQLLYRE